MIGVFKRPTSSGGMAPRSVRMAKARYMVSVCIAPGIPGYESAPVSIDHDFSSKTDAIRFARAVSRYFIAPDPAIRQGLVSMWCLVYTYPKDAEAIRTWGPKGTAFMCIDPGAVILWDRTSEIPTGYFGARVSHETHAEAA